LDTLVSPNLGTLDEKQSLVARIVPPVLFGITGVVVGLIVANVPHGHASIALGGLLVLCLIAQGIWLNQIIQSLRRDVKPVVTQKPALPIAPPPLQVVEEHTNIELAEAKFLSVLQSRLENAHPLHIEAKCLQSFKNHIIHTNGLLLLLKDNQVELLVEPIVNLPQKRLSFLSCIPSTTLSNGTLINLNSIVAPTIGNTKVFHQTIDMMFLLQTWQFIRRYHHSHPTHRFVCRLAPSIYQDPLCLDEIFTFFHKSRFPFRDLIFEVDLEEAEAHLSDLTSLNHHGAQLMGIWQNKPLPEKLASLSRPNIDFIALPYDDLIAWMAQWPRRQGLESLKEILNWPTQIIVSNVPQEQDLYQNLPLAFDFATGPAFGIPKPFSQLQL